MGVPVVALAGQIHAGRVGASLLHSVGLGELVTDRAQEYVARAVTLAEDRARLRALRAGMRERLRSSPLMDFSGFTRKLEAAYRAMWRHWCSS